MEKTFKLIIGGNNVGTILDLHLDWPHYLGKFEPSPLFEAYKEIFAGIHACKNGQRYDEMDIYWSRLFEIGVEIRTLENQLLFKRKGAPIPKDIAILSIHNNKISFRIFSVSVTPSTIIP